MPSVKCCILARPTMSAGLYLQQAGRILRPYQGARATILDHAGNTARHGLPQIDREFTLESREKRKGAAVEVATVMCKVCMLVLEGRPAVCPECGYVFEAASAELPVERPGELVEVDAVAEERETLLDRIAKAAKAMDRARRWKAGETNQRLIAHFRRSRTKMNADQLRAVLEYLKSDAFAGANPAPPPVIAFAADAEDDGPPELPAFLARPAVTARPSNDDDVIEVAI
jgi:superfamily II DNA or RNA helicase